MKGSKEGFYGWIALGAAALSLFMNGGAGYTFSAFLPVLHAEFGWPVGEISIAVSLAMGIMTLMAPVAGFFVGKFGVRLAVFAGNLLVAVSFFMLAVLQRQWQLHVAYAILGLGGGIGGIVAVGTLASSWFIEKAPLAMAINVAAMGLGGLALAPLSTALIQAAGWRQTYTVLGGAILLLAAIVPGIVIRNKPEELGQKPDGRATSSTGSDKGGGPAGMKRTAVDFTIKEAMGTSAFWFLCLYACMPLFIMMFIMAHQINFLTKAVGLSNDVAGLALGLVSGTSILGTLGMGVLALKFDVKRLTILATGLIVVSMIVGSVTTSAVLAFVYSILFGIGMGATMVSLMSLTAAYFGRTHFSKILGISMLFSLLSVLGAPVGGFIYDATKGYGLAFVVAISAGILGLLLLLLLRPPVHLSLKTGK